jgi:hypothetical protein
MAAATSRNWPQTKAAERSIVACGEDGSLASAEAAAEGGGEVCGGSAAACRRSSLLGTMVNLDAVRRPPLG